ncbi:MAG: hypothetical protein K0U93_26215 [Gammaproteobacteria bacterium]|nr:hypothetical protein [Gammaproteobacteria bacterium]
MLAFDLRTSTAVPTSEVRGWGLQGGAEVRRQCHESESDSGLTIATPAFRLRHGRLWSLNAMRSSMRTGDCVAPMAEDVRITGDLTH